MAYGAIPEPRRAVRLHHHIVWSVEPLALSAVGEDGDGPIIFADGVASGELDAARETMRAHIVAAGRPLRTLLPLRET
jgi:hypothetical protein